MLTPHVAVERYVLRPYQNDIAIIEHLTEAYANTVADPRWVQNFQEDYRGA